MDNICSDRVYRVVEETINEVRKKHCISKKFISKKRRELDEIREFFFGTELYKMQMFSNVLIALNMAGEILSIVDSYRNGLK